MEQAGAPPVIDGELAAFLEGGVAVFAASADPDKVPDATRVWGSAPDGRCLRILVATSATEALANLAATGRVAVCFTDVVTYRSVQLKGRVTDLPARAAPGDVALWKRYQDRFFAGRGHPVPEVADGAPVAGGRSARRGGGGRDLRPDPGAGGRPADRDGRGVTASLRAIARCFEGVIPPVVATCSPDGSPNVVQISQVHLVDDDHVALSNQFFTRTVANVAANPVASVLVVDPETFASYQLLVHHERSETEGEVFDGMHRRIEAIAALTGMAGVFSLRAVEIFRVLECRLVPAAPSPSAGEP